MNNNNKEKKKRKKKKKKKKTDNQRCYLQVKKDKYKCLIYAL